LAGAAGFVRAPQLLAAEETLETTTVRLAKTPGTCFAPQYVAEELLHAEGFRDIRYVDVANPTSDAIARGKVDLSLGFASALIIAIDAGEPITVLAGVHIGCVELFAREGIRSIADLKGKSAGVPALGHTSHVLVSIMAANVGLDPVKDIRWVADPSVELKELFTDGTIDAFMSVPPEAQELRARRMGHVILNSTLDRPWSQYYCCMLAGNQDYVRRHPVATKRVLRAILKAADLCITEPARVARRLVDGGFDDRYDYALQTLSEVPYDKWREYDAEDTIRFYALRLRETGFIKSNPQKIIADGTDWRFLNELKRELKA
jgi:NitT/TauT family transport system substrate-binding protein